MLQKTGRFKYMILLGIGVSFLLNYIIPSPNIGWNRLFDILTSVLITTLVWEGNLRIDFWMNLKFPWQISPIKRITTHLPISLIYTSLIMYVSMYGFSKYLCPSPKATQNSFMTIAIVVGLLVSITMLAIEISMQFFQQWKASLLEVEKYKTESTQAQLQNLKNQELTTLENELMFIHSYIYLLQIRFDANIQFDIQVPKEYHLQLLPPMALQLLIENAIKHNEISSELPLSISIKAEAHQLIVSNNLQLRSNDNEENRCKTGIQNIKDRYKYFTDKEVIVLKSVKLFTVQIPLLQAK